MACRAIAVDYLTGYQVGQENFDENGNFRLTVFTLYINLEDPTVKRAVLAPPILLDPTSPASWTAALKDGIVACGVQHESGWFTDLTTAGVYIPQYQN